MGTTGTSCDSDTLFPPRYFETLASQFLAHRTPHEVIWQAPLFYNFQLHMRPFFVRAISIIRTGFMMGFLIPFNINQMSVYSFSLALCIKSGFFHTHYQMEDFTFLLAATEACGKRVPIEMLPLPVVCGPTSGETLREEFREWYLQGERWTIGVCESFHFFIVKCKRLGVLPAFAYAFWYVSYYGFILCGLGLTGVLCSIHKLLMKNGDPLEPQWAWGLAWMLDSCVVYACFAVLFYIDRCGVRLMERLGMLTIGEDRVPWWRTLLHWLLAKPALLMYSVVTFWAILKVAIYGKSVCGHTAAKKEGLTVDLNVPQVRTATNV